jgi:choice-of-anchor C domain-containing protein
MHIFTKSITAFLAGCAFTGAAHAAAFTNGSFETITGGNNPASGTFSTLVAGNTSLTGWNITGGSIDVVNTNYFGPDFIASDGQNSVDLDGFSVGTIAQTFDTIIGNIYNVGFDLNANVYGGDAIKRVLVSAGAFSNVFSYDSALHPIGSGGPWQSHGFSFTATGSSTTLTFQSLTAGGGCCWGAELDNVSVAGAVPEPASWALMIAGFGLVGAAARRRAKVRVTYA